MQISFQDIVVYGQRIVCRERNPESVVTASTMASVQAAKPKAGPSTEMESIPEEIAPPMTRKNVEAALTSVTESEAKSPETAEVQPTVESDVEQAAKQSDTEIASTASGLDVAGSPGSKATPRKQVVKIDVNDDEIKAELEVMVFFS